MGKPASYRGPATQHKTRPGPTGPRTVYIHGREALCCGDKDHACPPGHKQGPILPKDQPNVFFNGKPAATAGNVVACGCGKKDPICEGSQSVHIGNKRMSPDPDLAEMQRQAGLAGLGVPGAPSPQQGEQPDPFLIPQEEPNYCIPAAMLMVLRSYGKDRGVTQRELFSKLGAGQFTVGDGRQYTLADFTMAQVQRIPDVLRNYGVTNATLRDLGSVRLGSQLWERTAGGQPAIVQFPQHVVVVRARPDGTLELHDPSPPGQGTRRVLSQNEFDTLDTTGTVITTNP